MRNLLDRPIRKKITLTVMMVAVAVLLPAFSVLFGFQVYTLRQHSLHELAVTGEMTAHNCVSAVMFKDEAVAAQILGGLRAIPQIVAGRLELVNHQRLAAIGNQRDLAEIKSAQLTSGFLIKGDRILLAQPVRVSGQREGTLYLLADLHAMTSQLLKVYGVVFALVLAVSLMVAFVVSSQSLRFVTNPILRLARLAQTVAEDNDYSVRATKEYADEVGTLTDAFNQMLTRIQSQDGELRGSEEKLALAQKIAHLGYWERDLDSDFIRWSDETYRIFGLVPGGNGIDLVRFCCLVHTEDRQRVTDAVATAITGGERYDEEYRIVRPDGEVRYVHSQGDIVRDEAGRPRRMFGTAQDTTERKQVEEALRNAEHKYRAIFENSIEGMFQTTPEGKFLSVNPALARMLGYQSPDELITSVNDIGESIYVDPRKREEFKRRIDRDGFVELLEFELYRTDRSKICVCENARAVRDAAGTILYYEGSIEDITQRKRVEEVERANTAKNEFLSRVSHELRTPLNAILGFGQLLERQNPTDAQRIRLRYILDAGNHLLKLINEVLDISRIESGRMQLSLEAVGVATTLSEALELMRPLAAARDIHFPVAPSVDPTLFIHADQQRFRQVLINVLNNAVKYTPVSGRITVSCQAYGEDRVRIFVKDTGPGIPYEKLNRLFLPFERLGAEESNVEGTGLGLALSQRLMQAMGGSIDVHSKVGEGSTFWLEFPRASTPSVMGAPQRRLAQTAEERSAAPERKVLYIEDNPSNLTLVEQLLEERPEIELLSARAGELGLMLANEHSPDLILLDIHLPDLDGYAVLSRLKASATTRDIPVVVVSADATTRQIERLMSAGASTYLTKPIDVTKFFQVLDKTTKGRNPTTNEEGFTRTETLDEHIHAIIR